MNSYYIQGNIVREYLYLIGSCMYFDSIFVPEKKILNPRFCKVAVFGLQPPRNAPGETGTPPLGINVKAEKFY